MTETINQSQGRFRGIVNRLKLNRPRFLLTKSQFLMGVFVLIMLQLLDFSTTIYALSMGLAREANPMFEDSTVYYFLVSKFLVISLLMMGYAYVNKTGRLEKVFSVILSIFIPVYLTVVANNVLVIFGVI